MEHFGLPVASLLTFAIGCQQCGPWGSHCNEIPPGAIPAPRGSYNSAWQHAQASRADQDFLVFYQYEWLGDSEQLSPFGTRHMDRLIPRLPHAATPIVVEASDDAERDQSRVAAIQAALASVDAAWSEYPVVVGRSDAESLYGIESPRVLSGFLGFGQGNQGGGGGGQGLGGGAGMGGGGGGMGGGGGGFGGGGMF